MEQLNAIALTFVRPKFPAEQLMSLYRAAGSATEIVENRTRLREIFPDLTDDGIAALENMDAALRRAEEELAFCEKLGIHVLTPDTDEYPHRLLICDDAPLVLYYRGTADLNCARVIDIIGTRKCTVYGQDLIRNFVKGVAEACPDALIVSGLAYGVDINAHRAALNEGLDTVAVLAHGLDQIYPSTHRDTARQMLDHGGIITEYPSRTRIDKVNFLQRNRIVAGLSDACILPESASHGGGLVTCRLSTDYGRQVYAFPGAVNAEYSKGCNNLIRTHRAEMITCAADFLEDMGWNNDATLAKARAEGIQQQLFMELSPTEKTIAEALKQHGDLHPDQLAAHTGMPISDITSNLFLMEMNGVVKQLAGSFYHLLDNF